MPGHDAGRNPLHHTDSPGESCGEVDHLLDEHISKVVRRIAELKALEREIRSLRAGCSEGGIAAQCGILGGLEKAARNHDHSAPSAHPSHSRGGRRHHQG
ncbi:MerR family DNA-binding protein [Caenimonas sedimenti]|uniref:MerR family DNA-binding protein n=1 Tax=Caenimonas sedimenti TaxID=2596921 RepID=UPI003D7AC3EB